MDSREAMRQAIPCLVDSVDLLCRSFRHTRNEMVPKRYFYFGSIFGTVKRPEFCSSRKLLFVIFIIRPKPVASSLPFGFLFGSRNVVPFGGWVHSWVQGSSY